MRTTNKCFKTQVREHIIDAIELHDGFATHTQIHEIKPKLKQVHDDFINWWGEYERKQQPNKQQAFIDWMNCLPTGFNIEFTNYGIYETLKTWFENCGEQYTEQTTDKEHHQYMNLVTREFRSMCRELGINF